METTELELASRQRELVFDPTHHEYRAEGKPIRGVTTILREAGMTPFGTGKPAGETEPMLVGSLVHRMLAYHFRGTLDETTISPTMREILDAVKEWGASVGIVPLRVEVPIFHPLYWYAGTPDLICLARDAYTVVDWKWGAWCASHSVQVSAYAEAAIVAYPALKNEHLRAATIYLPELLTGKPVHFLRGKELMQNFSMFVAANALYRWRKQNNLIR